MQFNVILVGTSHVFQFGRPPGCTDDQRADFMLYLIDACHRYAAKALLEEMNEDALREKDGSR